MKRKPAKVVEDDPLTVRYRGSICSFCLRPLLTNERGSVVRHADGKGYGECKEKHG